MRASSRERHDRQAEFVAVLEQVWGIVGQPATYQGATYPLLFGAFVLVWALVILSVLR